MLFMVMVRAYENLLEWQPVLTQICTAGFLATLADVISQRLIEGKSASYDYRRTVIMAFCGFLYFGPLVTLWYMALAWMKFEPITSVCLDQFLMSPIFLFGFLVVQTTLRGYGLREIKRRLHSEFFAITTANWIAKHSANVSRSSGMSSASSTDFMAVALSSSDEDILDAFSEF